MQAPKAKRTTSAVATMLAMLFVSTHALAQARKPAPPDPPPKPTDFLEAVNETPGTVRLELFPAGDPMAKGARAQLFACMKSKESVRWLIDRAAPGGKIRLQVMQGDTCEEPPKVACERSIDRAPGLQYVTLRGEGRGCGVFPMPAPAGGMLKAAGDCGPTNHWAPLTIHNKDPHNAIWVTIYENKHNPNGGPPILAAACWLPEEKRMACVDRRNLIIRAEFVHQDRWGRAPHCSLPVYRDTGIMGGFLLDMDRWWQGYYLSAHCPGHECRWQ